MNNNQCLINGMHRLFQLLFWVVPLSAILYWAFVPESVIISSVAVPKQLVTVSTATRILCALAQVLPISLIMYALTLLTDLFAHYKQHSIFTDENIAIYRKLSYILLIWVFVAYLNEAAQSFILTYQSQMKYVSIIFKASDIKALVAGGICLVISRVMQEAREISEEQELTI